MVKEILWPIVSLGGLGFLFGAGLGIANKKFGVASDPKVDAVREVLPGANCGACGYPGCDGFASAAVKGEAPPDGCTVGGGPVGQKVAAILGMEVEEKEPTVARVMCNGDCQSAKNKYEYDGIQDCVAASMLSDGPKSCRFGCMGLGSCVKACPFDAIHVIDGIAVVDEEKCTSCGKCVVACPKGIIRIVPKSNKVHVLCMSKDAGKIVRTNCDVGCIGCRMCTKVCPTEAIKVNNNLASIDYSKCINCGKCAEKCPTKAIYIKSEAQ